MKRGKKKRYGVQSTLRSNRFVVFQRNEWDDDYEPEIGQPMSDKSNEGK